MYPPKEEPSTDTVCRLEFQRESGTFSPAQLRRLKNSIVFARHRLYDCFRQLARFRRIALPEMVFATSLFEAIASIFEKIFNDLTSLRPPQRSLASPSPATCQKNTHNVRVPIRQAHLRKLVVVLRF